MIHDATGREAFTADRDDLNPPRIVDPAEITLADGARA